MKKYFTVILLVLIIMPITALAATQPNVKELTAEAKDKVINYSGEMEDGSYAVMCKLLNANGEEIDLLSSAVDSNKFQGSFTTIDNGDYKVACANYEGGEIKEATVTVTSDTTSNPKTFDAGSTQYIILLTICLTGLAGYIIYYKKKRFN